MDGAEENRQNEEGSWLLLEKTVMHGAPAGKVNSDSASIMQDVAMLLFPGRAPGGNQCGQSAPRALVAASSILAA
jgi:hypothetical protein